MQYAKGRISKKEPFRIYDFRDGGFDPDGLSKSSNPKIPPNFDTRRTRIVGNCLDLHLGPNPNPPPP